MLALGRTGLTEASFSRKGRDPGLAGVRAAPTFLQGRASCLFSNSRAELLEHEELNHKLKLETDPS